MWKRSKLTNYIRARCVSIWLNKKWEKYDFNGERQVAVDNLLAERKFYDANLDLDSIQTEF